MDPLKRLETSRYSATRPAARVTTILESHRRAAQAGRLGEATLACPDCDVPIALGPGGHPPTESLRCPFCGRRRPLRECLSLAQPVRAARVEVRVAVRD